MLTKKRWRELEKNPDAYLTDAELAEGWHFCYDWNGMLIGPGMIEFDDCCTCEVRQGNQDDHSQR
jgi:hypothetical protein